MTSIEQNLTQYAAYHRDRRNIATHFVGVPMIVFAVVLALAVVEIPAGPVVLTLAALTSIAASVYYLRLESTVGHTVAPALSAPRAGASEPPPPASTGPALPIALAVVVAGSPIQFVGHRLEGIQPPFGDDQEQAALIPAHLWRTNWIE